MSDKPTFPPAMPSLVKPTLTTPFHIDRDWWERKAMPLRAEVRNHLCPEHREAFSGPLDTEEIDWVDERTGEVTRVDGLWHVLKIHCSQQPEYINERLSLIDAVFRVFLANGNRPLTSEEMSSIIGHPADKILHTLAGRRVYKGIRPVPRG